MPVRGAVDPPRSAAELATVNIAPPPLAVDGSPTAKPVCDIALALVSLHSSTRTATVLSTVTLSAPPVVPSPTSTATSRPAVKRNGTKVGVAALDAEAFAVADAIIVAEDVTELMEELGPVRVTEDVGLSTALKDTEGDTVCVADRETVALVETVEDGESDGVGEAVAKAEAEADGVTEVLKLAVAEAEPDGVGDSVGPPIALHTGSPVL